MEIEVPQKDKNKLTNKKKKEKTFYTKTFSNDNLSAPGFTTKTVYRIAVKIFGESVGSHIQFPYTLTHWINCSLKKEAHEVEKELSELISDNIDDERRLFVIFGDRSFQLEKKDHPARIYRHYIYYAVYNQTNQNDNGNNPYLRFEFQFKPKEKIPVCTCKHPEVLDLYGVDHRGCIPVAIASKKCKHIILSGCCLSSIPEECPENMEELDFCGNNLNRNGIHQICRFSGLRRVCLNNNLITSIPVDALKNMKSLEWLSLNDNLFTSIPSEIGLLENIKLLSFSRNRIKKVSSAIRKLEKLEYLILLDNLLQTVPKEIFRHPTIKHLQLAGNRIPTSHLETLPLNIVAFGFDCNQINLLDPAIKEEENERILESSKSETEMEVEISAIFTDKDTKEKTRNILGDDCILSLLKTRLNNILRLTMRRNKLSNLPGEIFDYMPNLKYLDISKNLLLQLPKKIEELKSLAILSAEGNNIRLISLDFSKMKNLRCLRLHLNNIKTIPCSIWHCPLNMLNISSNELEGFPVYIGPETKEEVDSSLKKKKEKTDSKKTCRCYKPISSEEKKDIGNTRLEEATHEFVDKDLLYIVGKLEEEERRVLYPCLMKRDDYVEYLLYGGTGFKAKTKRGTNSKNSLLSNSLRKLDLGNNKITTKGAEPLKLLSSLAWLNLSLNEIRDSLKIFTNMRNLAFLNISNNCLTRLPRTLSSCVSLRTLLMSCNHLVSLSSDIMKSFKHLESLDLSFNDIFFKKNGFEQEWHWNQTPTLKILNLRYNTRLYSGINSITHLHKETFFSRRRSLFDLPELAYLNVMGTQIHKNHLPPETDIRTVIKSNVEKNGLGSTSSFFFNNYVTTEVTTETSEFILSHGREEYKIFGMFKSHNGANISRFVQRRFQEIFQREFFLGPKRTMERVLENTFLEIDLLILDDKKMMKETCSITAVVMVGKILYVVNTGTNRAFLYKKTSSVMLTVEETWDKETNAFRLRNCWANYSFTKKTNFPIQPRTLGAFHKPEMTGFPTVKVFNLTKEDTFIIIGTRAFWETSNPLDTNTAILSTPFSESGVHLRDLQTSTACTSSAGLIIDLEKTVIWTLTEVKPPPRRRTNSLAELKENRAIAYLKKEIEAPIGNVAFAFTDIKNSSENWTEYPLIMHAAIQLHSDLMRRLLRRLGGYEVKKEGDSFFAAFPNPELAFLWCCLAQIQLLQLDLPDEIYEQETGRPIYEGNKLIHRGLSIRMGIHLAHGIDGTFDPITKRTDYLGKEVIKAARISGIADGGQIALSKEVYECIPGFSIDTLEEAGNPKLFYAGEILLKGLGMEEIYIVYPEHLAARAKTSLLPLKPVGQAETNKKEEVRDLSYEEGDYGPQ
eukprot:GHVP01053257.1.p1 GENE.GHVP01053257.1~~GHVP01053257.1.p1  ORF type:complete len:1356 (+),score=248.01 GHVP01053257.1:31-4098(+)